MIKQLLSEIHDHYQHSEDSKYMTTNALRMPIKYKDHIFVFGDCHGVVYSAYTSSVTFITEDNGFWFEDQPFGFFPIYIDDIQTVLSILNSYLKCVAKIDYYVNTDSICGVTVDNKYLKTVPDTF